MRKRVGLVAGLLIVALGSGVVAQSPAGAGLEAGVRLDVPEAGIALTIPAGWHVSVEYRPAEPPPGQSMPAHERWAVLAANEDSDALNGCRLMQYRAKGFTLEEFAAGLLVDEQSTMTPVRLDAGEAMRLDLPLEGPITAQQYVIGSGDDFYQLACLAEGEMADDRWLSMADSLEFRPGEVAQSPEPVATLPYAPDDLVSILPSSIGDIPFHVVAGPNSLDGGRREWWSDLLLRLGRVPSDVRQASGAGRPAGVAWDGAPLGVAATRVDGVLAATWVEQLRDRYLAGNDDVLEAEWRVMGEREVLAITFTDEALADATEQGWPTGLYLYPVGEVMFIVTMPGYGYPDDTPTIEDVLAELP